MKITPTMPGNHPTATMAGSSQPRKSTATTATTLSADDITQAGWLIYRVYHEVIGQADGADYCPLVCDFYLIRTLISLWTLDGSPLRQEDIFALFAMFERWRESENAVLIRQQIQAERSADPLLYAFSLLSC